MGDKMQDTSLPSPSRDIFFDGNPVDLDRLFAHCAIQALIKPPAFAETKAMVSYLLAHFRGPALDWAARKLSDNSIQNYRGDYAGFCEEVKTQFGYSASQGMVIARTRLNALKQTGGMREFILEFDDLCAQAGLSSDVTKTTLAFPKLKKFYQDAWTCETSLLNVTWASVRTFLLNVASRHEEHGKTEEDARKKAKCGKCGKRGHTASQCRSSN